MSSMGQHQAILSALKRALKGQSITYKLLANKLDLSEAGVKRLLNAKDVSLGRVMQICEILNMELTDLLEASKNEEIVEQTFSDDTIAFFKHNFEFLKYFFLLQIENLSPIEIQEKYNLDSKTTFKYLRELDRLGLIKLQADNKALIQPGAMQWRIPHAPLLKLKYDGVRNLVDYFEKNGPDAEGFFPFYQFGFSSRTLADFQKALSEVVREFTNRSIRESRFADPKSLKSVSVSYQITQQSYIKNLEKNVSPKR